MRTEMCMYVEVCIERHVGILKEICANVFVCTLKSVCLCVGTVYLCMSEDDITEVCVYDCICTCTLE